jgi:hypothetical protein
MCKSVYQTEEDMKHDLKKSKTFDMTYKFNPLESMKHSTIKKAELKQLLTDPDLSNDFHESHFQGHPTLVYIRKTNTLGFINAFKPDYLTETKHIEPLAEPISIELVPSSNLYQETDSRHFKQIFSLCFFISSKNNAFFKNSLQSYKNRGIIQVFELEVSWSNSFFDSNQHQIKLIGQRLIVNVNLIDSDDVH